MFVSSLDRVESWQQRSDTPFRNCVIFSVQQPLHPPMMMMITLETGWLHNPLVDFEVAGAIKRKGVPVRWFPSSPPLCKCSPRLMAQDSSLLPFKVAPSSDLADVTMWSERAEWNGTGWDGRMDGWWARWARRAGILTHAHVNGRSFRSGWQGDGGRQDFAWVKVRVLAQLWQCDLQSYFHLHFPSWLLFSCGRNIYYIITIKHSNCHV